MGIAAGIGSAVLWAVASALMTQQAQRMDTLSLSLIRAIGAGGFFVAALFALGAQDELWALATHDLWRLSFAGFLASGLGETLYAAALFLIGMTRTFTIVVGLQILLSFALAAIFLDEPATWTDGLGAVLISIGVYAVALYGRSETQSPSPVQQLRLIGHLARRWTTTPRGALAMENVAAGSIALNRSPDALHHMSLATVRAAVIPSASAAAPLDTSHGTSPRQHAWTWLMAHRLAAGVGVACLTALIFAIASVMLRDASIDVDAAAATLPRMPLILGFLAPLVLLWPGSNVRRRDISRRSIAILLLVGAIGSGAAALLFIPAVQELGTGGAVAVISTSPLFALPLAVIFLKEKITRWAVIGTMVALTGIILLA